MRITRIKGSLAYYAVRELDDEGIDEASLTGMEDVARGVPWRVKALDLTIAVPKSVSVAWALADEAGRRRVEAAHRRAVGAVLGEIGALEWSRPARDGTPIPLRGIASLPVHHRLSRAGDPHLHAHVLVVNAGTADGRRRAVDHWRLGAHLGVYELLYRVALASELAPLGLRLEGEGLGPWRLADQAPGLVELFSKRRREVLEEAWSTSGRARQLAVLATRPPKVARDLAELTARWEGEARQLPRAQREPVSTGWPRVGDPLLAECVRAISEGAGSVARAWEVALSRALGEETASQLLRGEEVTVSGARLCRDGTLLEGYRCMPLAERIGRAGGTFRPLVAPRELGGLIGSLAREAAAPGQRLELRGRSPEEEALVAGVGQYRPGPHAPLVVIDANAVAPSELARLTRERTAMVRVGESSAGGRGDAGSVANIPCVDGGRLLIAEDALALWHAFVELGATAVRDRGSQLVVPNEVVGRRLRREIAHAHPELAATPGGGLLVGELVRTSADVIGRVVRAEGGDVLVATNAGVARHRVRDLDGLGVICEGTDRLAAHVVSFGASRGRFLAGDQVCLVQPGVEELVAAFGTRGMVEIPDAVHADLFARRKALMACRDQPEARAELDALRVATRKLFLSYLYARELGLDERCGMERSLPALGIEEPHLARATEESWRALRREPALVW